MASIILFLALYLVFPSPLFFMILVEILDLMEMNPPCRITIMNVLITICENGVKPAAPIVKITGGIGRP